MRGFSALYIREVRILVFLFPALLFFVLGIMAIPIIFDLSSNGTFVSFITVINNTSFYIPPLFHILSFQRDVQTRFSALSSFQTSGAGIMIAKNLAALTLGVVISAAASIWPFQENSLTARGLFQMEQGGTGYLLLTFRYFLNILFFTGLACLAEGLQFTVNRRRGLVWAAVFLGGTGLLFLPGKSVYRPLFADFSVQDGFILISGVVFFLAGMVFFNRYGRIQKGLE